MSDEHPNDAYQNPRPPVQAAPQPVIPGPQPSTSVDDEQTPTEKYYEEVREGGDPDEARESAQKLHKEQQERAAEERQEYADQTDDERAEAAEKRDQEKRDAEEQADQKDEKKAQPLAGAKRKR